MDALVHVILYIVFIFCVCREKAGCEADSFLAQRMTKGIVLEFEHGDASRRMRLMLSQLLFIVSQVFICFFLPV